MQVLHADAARHNHGLQLEAGSRPACPPVAVEELAEAAVHSYGPQLEVGLLAGPLVSANSPAVRSNEAVLGLLIGDGASEGSAAPSPCLARSSPVGRALAVHAATALGWLPILAYAASPGAAGWYAAANASNYVWGCWFRRSAATCWDVPLFGQGWPIEPCAQSQKPEGRSAPRGRPINLTSLGHEQQQWIYHPLPLASSGHPAQRLGNPLVLTSLGRRAQRTDHPLPAVDGRLLGDARVPAPAWPPGREAESAFSALNLESPVR